MVVTEETRKAHRRTDRNGVVEMEQQISLFDINYIKPDKPMNVLIACEESQRVCIAFRDKGHRAFSCDIQECSGGHPEWHIQGDVLPLLNGNCTFRTGDGIVHHTGGHWDLIIAHPPCTYLSNAGACRMYRYFGGERWINDKRFEQMKEGRDFFLQFLNAECDRIAIENPTPLKLANLPEETQAIQPYEYGHPYSKRTLLWLKGLPKLIPTNIVDKHIPYLPSNTSMFAKGLGGSRGSADAKTAKGRSKTFSGIAKAMADQWG